MICHECVLAKSFFVMPALTLTVDSDLRANERASIINPGLSLNCDFVESKKRDRELLNWFFFSWHARVGAAECAHTKKTNPSCTRCTMLTRTSGRRLPGQSLSRSFAASIEPLPTAFRQWIRHILIRRRLTLSVGAGQCTPRGLHSTPAQELCAIAPMSLSHYYFAIKALCQRVLNAMNHSLSQSSGRVTARDPRNFIPHLI